MVTAYKGRGVLKKLKPNFLISMELRAFFLRWTYNKTMNFVRNMVKTKRNMAVTFVG